MELSSKILSDITVHMKYARHLEDEKRRETWEELVTRNKKMHVKRYPDLESEIDKAYTSVYEKKVLPSMRALEDSTPIMTKNGWKSAGDVKRGDILYSSLGKETTVKDVVKFSDKNIFRITFSDKSELLACDEHLWIVSTIDDRRKDRGGMKTRVVDTKFLREHLMQGAKYNIAVWNPEPIQRQAKKLPVDPYILGHWLGDGYSTGSQISCSEEDAEYITAQYRKEGYSTTPSNSSNIWAHSVYGLRVPLKEANLVNNKHIPRVYLEGSIEQRLSLVQGLMDSDGCVEKTGRCHFSNTNSEILEGFKEALSSLGIKYICITSSPKRPHHKEGQTVSFFTSLQVARLPRKLKNIRQSNSQRTQLRMVKEVEMMGRASATCFHVDSEDHSFLAGREMIVTHNSMQFAGKPIEVAPNRVFNCAYMPIDDLRAFSETMFLLLGGTGVGYSVQSHHIESLPEIRKPNTKRTRRYLVADSIEGWADSVKALTASYFNGSSKLRFDFSDIRPKGAKLVTSGGKAPGPQPLKECLVKLEGVLDSKEDGDRLSSLEVHDMICYIADAVLAGGIRRAALICLFSADDDEMISSKSGNWWETNPQRGRANNSIVLMRHRITKEYFMSLWGRIKASGSGEPGFYFTNDKDWGTNPSLRSGTKVVTTDGVFPIEELAGRTFSVKNLNGEVSEAKCWLSGKGQKLYKLNLTGNHSYYATAEHEWPIWNGEEYIKVKTPDIASGSELPVIKQDKLFDGDLGNYEDGFVVGWQIGDGWMSTRGDNGCIQHGFVVSTKDCDSGVDKRIESYLNSLGSNAKFHSRGTTKELNTVSNVLNKNIEKFQVKTKSEGLPASAWKGGSEEFRKGLIDGLFSSDGHIEKGKKRIVFTTKHNKLANDVSELLGFYGIKSTLRASHAKLGDKSFPRFDVRIADGASIRHFRKLFKLSVGYKQDTLDSYEFPYDLTSDKIKVVSVEETDLYEDVWDISVFDQTHCFQIAHCITGNCCEIGLRPFQFCNLVEINASNLEGQEDFDERATSAAFIGTLQASYTDFHYLRPIWQRNTEKDALIGVSMTGIASGAVLNLDMQKAAKIIAIENKRVADIVGINPAARQTCVKPAGTTSLTLGTSSGIHAWHNEYYIRRLRVGKNEAIYSYLRDHHPELVEDEYFRPHDTAIISVPQKAPDGAILRQESAIDLLERIRLITNKWVRPGYVRGQNTHNVSATISIKDNEWDAVADWMWENRGVYNGLSVLPFSDHSYIQAPFEDCSKEEYEEMMNVLKEVSLVNVVESSDTTNLAGELACAGGSCSISYL